MTEHRDISGRCRPAIVLELFALIQRINNLAELAETGAHVDACTYGVRLGLLSATDIIDSRIHEIGLDAVNASDKSRN